MNLVKRGTRRVIKVTVLGLEQGSHDSESNRIITSFLPKLLHNCGHDVARTLICYQTNN